MHESDPPAHHGGFRARVAVLLGAGLVLGPAMDQIHVQTGTLWYEHPALLEQAWWVGPQFALAFVALDVGARQVLALAGRRRALATPSISRAPTWWLVVAFLGAYAVTGLLHEHELAVMGMLAAAFALRTAFERLGFAALAMALLLGVAGTAYEALLVHVPGSFSYPEGSRLAGVPLWLPLLYAHGAPALLRASSSLPFGMPFVRRSA